MAKMDANSKYQIDQHAKFMVENRRIKAIEFALGLPRDSLTKVADLVTEASVIEHYLSTGATPKAKKTKRP